MRHFPQWLFSLVFLFNVASIVRAEPADDEKLLQSVGVAVDGSSLLHFFRQRTPSADARRQMETLVRELGDPSFLVREKATLALIAQGPPARSVLLRAADAVDTEVKQRALRCLEAIAAVPDAALASAAARLVQIRKPTGACAVLLDYLPTVQDEGVEEDILGALVATGLNNDKTDPRLLTALKDELARRRGAAALVVGRLGNAEEKASVRRLLAEADPKVRLRAVQGLLGSKDMACMPALLALLTDAPLAIASQAEDVLTRLAGEQAPALALGVLPLERKRSRESWEAWWLANDGKLDLAKLDGDLLFCNPARRASEVSLKFLNAFVGNDPATITSTSEAPFLPESWSNNVIAKREDLTKFFAEQMRNTQGGRYTFAVMKVDGTDWYKKAAETELAKFLAAQQKANVKAVSVEYEDRQGQYKDVLVLFVRVSGSQARVIGLTSRRPDK
jgi:HEAT repeat protein